MTDHRERSHNPPATGVLRLVAYPLILLLFYVLSIGPAYTYFSGPMLPAVYRPLTLLEIHCRPLDICMTWYMEKVWNIGKW
jgi:hypothetical protein